MRVWDLVSFLKQCSSLKQIQQLHAFFIPRALHRRNILLAELIRACSSLGHSAYARPIFAHAKNPNTHLHNALIQALSPSEAVPIYSATLVSPLRPDSYTVRFLLKAVTELSDVEAARQIHGQAVSTGLVSDAGVVAAFVRAYSHSGRVFDARKLFDEMGNRDVALWNAMVVGYAEAGELGNARDVFECMPERNLVSWASLIAGFSRAKLPGEAICIFRRMRFESVEPDEVATLAVIASCAHLGSLEIGETLHGYVLKRGFCSKLRINNALVDMYAKSGSVRRASDVFESVEEKSVVTWTAMISGLALHGLGREATEMFAQMERARVKPNEITYVALLSACSHAGLVETGRWYFNNMASKHGIRPKIEHYGCMVDLLGRAGFLNEAMELIRLMPFEANAALWGSILSTSNILGDVELEPHNSGNYMLLSDIYSTLGDCGDSGVLRKVMMDTVNKKTLGESLIEVNNIVHRFVAGDTSDSESYRALVIVCQMFNHLRIDAYLQEEILELHEFHE